MFTVSSTRKIVRKLVANYVNTCHVHFGNMIISETFSSLQSSPFSHVISRWGFLSSLLAEKSVARTSARVDAPTALATIMVVVVMVARYFRVNALPRWRPCGTLGRMAERLRALGPAWGMLPRPESACIHVYVHERRARPCIRVGVPPANRGDSQPWGKTRPESALNTLTATSHISRMTPLFSWEL